MAVGQSSARRYLLSTYCVSRPVRGSLFLLQEVLLTLGAPWGSFSSPRLFPHLSLCTSKRLRPCEHHRAPHPPEQWLPNPVEPQNMPQLHDIAGPRDSVPVGEWLWCLWFSALSGFGTPAQASEPKAWALCPQN